MQGALHDALTRVISEQVEPNAVGVDSEARFPRSNIDALAGAGLLGLVSSPDVGGAGEGPGAAAAVVGALAEHCSSTAMIVCMHYAATVVIEAFGPEDVRRSIAGGEHLSTLAFSERGSRSHFWAPMSSAVISGETATLDANKSWVTSAGEAQSYVWSSLPAEAEGASTLWFVPAETKGLKIDGAFDGLGLRGNASCPVSATDATIPAANLLGTDGGGFDIMIGTVLPWFNLMNTAASIGTMRASLARTIAHLTGTRLEHLDETLADNPVTRAHLARAWVQTDQVAALLDICVAAVEAGADDAVLRVLESKAASSDAVIAVTDACMRLCGGSAFRKEVGVDRFFRDSRAAGVMAPTTDTLYEFIGKAVCGIPLF